MSAAKTVIAPCMGVGKIVANVTRRSSYLIKGQCPEDVELLSIPALLAGDAHERDLIQNNPSIVIDGCALRCAAHIYRMFGVEPIAKIEVNQIMKERKLGPGKTRKELEETGKRLSAFTAERVMQALSDEGLEAQFSPLGELAEPPPDAGSGCPDRNLGIMAISNDAGSTGHGQDAHATTTARPADAPEACKTGPAGEQTSAGKHKVKSVTIIPCQGIKRTGGRVTQRAAYEIVEDRFLGRSQVLCISALAAGVQEDVDMLEQFPSVAINGCGVRCATIAAEHHGVPAVASVDLQQIDPGFNGEAYCQDADVTETEAKEALKLADAVANAVEGLLDHEIDWAPGRIDLHGVVHEPGKINALTGYGDAGNGILVQLAKLRQAPVPPASRRQAEQPAPATLAAALPIESAAKADTRSDDNIDPAAAKRVLSNLFKPKPKQ